MRPLRISVTSATPASHTAAPGVVFRLRIEHLGAGRIHAVALRTQVRIEPRRRRYTADEQHRLYELFGHPSQWERTLQNVTWAQPTVLVPAFEDVTDVEMLVPCTYDMEVAASKYLHAVRDGAVPLVFLFTGTVFTCTESLTVEPIPWDLEASFQMSSTTWREAMDRFFPAGGWLRLQRDTLDRLQAYRGLHAVVTWDEAIDLLLQSASAPQAAV